MSDERRCKNCRFWHQVSRSTGTGQCRKHAPVPRLDGHAWAATTESDWCGEFEPGKDESDG